ncbi:MAG: PspC domain-containing protein [Bacteroidota bacterium]
MAEERYRSSQQFDERFDTSLMYDDIERIRDREEAVEKNENDKLSFAGMMALIAGIGIVVLGTVGNLIPLDILEFLSGALPVVGFGALGYGFYKTLKLAFRKRDLNFPALNVSRKTRKRPDTREEARPRPNSTSAGATSRSRTYQRSEARARRQESRTYRRRQARRQPIKKNLQRSRQNRVFSGVAGGIAEYAGISPALVRFAFIAGLFMSQGMFVFVYLLLSIILPTEFEDFQFDEEEERNN